MAEKSTVATTSSAVDAMAPGWKLAAALLGGTAAMRAAGDAYLPKWPKEDRDSYAKRLSVSVLYPAYQRTVDTLSAKPFSKPVTIGDDVPQDLRELLDDVDLQGRNLDRFAADVMECGLGYGLCGILVDYPDATQAPATAAGVRTMADERAAGLRPYWVHILPGVIVGWRASVVGGRWVLRMLRLRECIEEDDGEFGTREVEQIRVLEPGKWAVWRRNDKQEWALYSQGRTTLDFIPFVPVYGRRAGFMMGRPPLEQLAHLNIAHWQSASDQQNILHVARVPILTAVNVSDSVSQSGVPVPWELSIGAGAAVRINGTNADLKYVEHSGAAISAGAQDLKDLEERMRQAGAELLVIGGGGKTRIEAAGDNEVSMCALQRMTLALEDALDQALDYTGRWLGKAEGESGHVELYKDFGALTLQEASADLLLNVNMAGKISDETLHSELQRRGILAPDNTWQDEQERIGTQGPALGNLEPAANAAA